MAANCLRLLMTMLSVCALAFVACGGKETGPDQPLPAPVRDPGVIHVHGLGVNPKDGALYAATHTGLFRISDGTATRIGDRYQDTMGFTVAGPDHFLGSGHPDMRDYTSGKLPGLLGFIESKDAGLTWKPQALLGKADLHALATSQGMIYGFDSTNEKLLRSRDGKSWEERYSLPILNLAVDPTDANVLLAATSRGLQRSHDGGKSWTLVQVPRFALLTWTNAELFALDDAGRAFQSHDQGQSWAPRGTLPGRPEAITAADTRLFAAVMEQGIYVSMDGGATWMLYYKAPS